MLDNWFRVHGPMGTYRTCASCRFMPQVGPAFCQLANQTPPIDTIMRGCAKYEDVRPETATARRRRMNPLPEGLDEDIPF